MGSLRGSRLPPDEDGDELEDGMTDAEHSAALSSRIPSLEGTQHISDKADELIAKYAAGDDAGFFLSSLPAPARESVKTATIRQAFHVAKQLGALEEREAIVKWLSGLEDMRNSQYDIQEALIVAIKAEKHK